MEAKAAFLSASLPLPQNNRFRSPVWVAITLGSCVKIVSF